MDPVNPSQNKTDKKIVYAILGTIILVTILICGTVLYVFNLTFENIQMMEQVTTDGDQ